MIGYGFLLSRIPLRMPPLPQPAKVQPVRRIEARADVLAVPRDMAPADERILSHLLFALKHERMQLPILHEALRLVPAQEMRDALMATPSGAYVRRAAWLWEKVHGEPLPLPEGTVQAAYLGFFDDQRYYTGRSWERDPKYRIDFNGIGPYAYCPVVERDAVLEAEGEAVLTELSRWVQAPQNGRLMDRILSWAYLAETRDSFALEREKPSPDKESAFLRALAQLGEVQTLGEDYLVELQNLIVRSPYAMEAGFRMSQNWLQRGGHGAVAVQYVPPAPTDLHRLITGWLAMANAVDDVPPLIKAALVSFGFVFLHPFMDGNGRLSRLLIHHVLQAKGVLPAIQGAPAILPLSVVMKQQESAYLHTLESFSKPARALWDVRFIDQDQFAFDFRSTPMIYGHWAGDAAAAFVTQCARTAWQQCLVDEAQYLRAYDRAYADIDKRFELPDRTINLLIQWIRQNGGKLSARHRSADELKYRLTEEDMNAIERLVDEAFEAPAAEVGGRE